MSQSRPLFRLFSSFSHHNSIINWKNIDGVLRIRTQGRRMVGADKTTELWRPPIPVACFIWLDSAALLLFNEKQIYLFGQIRTSHTEVSWTVILPSWNKLAFSGDTWKLHLGRSSGPKIWCKFYLHWLVKIEKPSMAYILPFVQSIRTLGNQSRLIRELPDTLTSVVSQVA